MPSWLNAIIASMFFYWLFAIMSKSSPQNQDKFIVRLPNGMRDDIKRLAESNQRSMNSEIIHALKIHLYASGGPEREYSEFENLVSDLSIVQMGLQVAERLLANSKDPKIAEAMESLGWRVQQEMPSQE